MTEDLKPDRLSLDVEIREAAGWEMVLREATQSVEQELAIEDAGWLKLGGVATADLADSVRRQAVRDSRLFYMKDPLARQAIRLWTDYSFGTGPTFKAEDEDAQKVLDTFWGNKANRSVLSPIGQRKGSDRLLVDGEVFLAVFLGGRGESKIRFIDPLEITEIISDPDDAADVRYYRRQWITPQGKQESKLYRSLANVKDESTLDARGNEIRSTATAAIYHLTINTIGQRGNPLLLPAIDWIRQYRRFLASRVAIMLALTRFAWLTKIDGGAAAVATEKAVLEGKTPDAGSTRIENMGSSTTPIRTDSGARNAMDDARMLKLQVSAAVGIPEQYFGDISTGNLATAKTVELPMLKQFQSHQQVWMETWRAIDEAIMDNDGIAPDKQYVDRDFAAIVPEDAAELAKSIQAIVQTFPGFANIEDVKQVALLSIGIDDVAKVLEDMGESGGPATTGQLIRAVESLTKELRDGSEDGAV